MSRSPSRASLAPQTFDLVERLFRLGSVEIIPLSEDQPEGLWQMVSRPRLVHEQIVATINKAKQGGCV